MYKQKNLMGKSKDIEDPYAVWQGFGPFGETEVRLLKVYQRPELELKNNYARWFVAVKSDFTYGSWELGDTYLKDAIRGLQFIKSSDTFKKQYGLYLNDLVDFTGMRKM